MLTSLAFYYTQQIKYNDYYDSVYDPGPWRKIPVPKAIPQYSWGTFT